MVCAVSEAVFGGMAAHELMVLGVARGGPWPPRVECRSDPGSSLGRANPPQVWRLLPPPSDGGKRRRSSAGRATISTIGRGSFVSWAASVGAAIGAAMATTLATKTAGCWRRARWWRPSSDGGRAPGVVAALVGPRVALVGGAVGRITCMHSIELIKSTSNLYNRKL